MNYYFDRAFSADPENCFYAQHLLSRYYQEIGENEKAVQWIRRGCERKVVCCEYLMGQLCREGRLVERSLESAKRYFRLASEQNDAAAKYCYACLVKESEDATPQELALMLRLLEELAANKEHEHQKEALYHLGQCYKEGLFVERSVFRAVEYLQKSANMGDVDAQHLLGCIFLYDMNEEPRAQNTLKQNLAMGIHWLKTAAQHHSKEALCLLGECYKEGKGVEQDAQKSFEYHKQAADLGFSESQLEVAYCYSEGTAVEENDALAAEYFLKAALQDLPEAMWKYGQALLNGLGLAKNLEEGNLWLQKAASLGYAEEPPANSDDDEAPQGEVEGGEEDEEGDEEGGEEEEGDEDEEGGEEEEEGGEGEEEEDQSESAN